jgi:hypothetical protein
MAESLAVFLRTIKVEEKYILGSCMVQSLYEILLLSSVVECEIGEECGMGWGEQK